MGHQLLQSGPTLLLTVEASPRYHYSLLGLPFGQPFFAEATSATGTRSLRKKVKDAV